MKCPIANPRKSRSASADSRGLGSLLRHVTSRRCHPIGCSVSFLMLLQAVAHGQTYSDDTFVDGHWTLTVVEYNNGGSAIADQQRTGGNTDEYRRYFHTVNRPSATESAGVHVYHLFNAGTWDPATDGPIESIAFSEDRRTAAAQIGASLGLSQNGVLYFASTVYKIDGLDSPAARWNSWSFSGLTCEDFRASKPLDPTLKPDFLSSGAPITFGFMRANSQDAGSSSGYTVEGGTDNWSVTITPGDPIDVCAPIPTLSQWGVLILALGVLGAGCAIILRNRSYRALHP